jgi:predicted RND superfamily exporter protein
MAIVVIGGLATSTLLTLVVVPAIFTYLDAFQDRLDRGVLRRVQERQEEEKREEALRH